jgi:uncharacterized MAPEG superfamily protein
MTTALWCVLVASLLPIICVGIAKVSGGRYNNRNPREWLSRLQGMPARANAAQQNSWEALAMFSAAVFASQLAHAPQARVDVLAMAFIAVRLIYIAVYLANLAALRSLVWTVGLGLCIALFAAAVSTAA